MQRSYDNRRSPSAKSQRLPVMDAPRSSMTARDVCPAYRKECSKCNRKGHFAEQCHSKGNADSSSKRFTKQKQIPGPKKKFHETTAASEGSEADFSEHDTDKVTVQINSVEAKAKKKQVYQDAFWQETAQTSYKCLFRCIVCQC